MRWRLVIASVAIASTLPWVACVGDDPASSSSGGTTDGGEPLIGDYLGQCFPDGTCKTGLECDSQLKRCKKPGEQLDAAAFDTGTTSDTGASDAVSEETGSVQCNAVQLVTNDEQNLSCPNGTSAGPVKVCTTADGLGCCPDATTSPSVCVAAGTACLSNQPSWQCFTEKNCPAGLHCCAQGTITPEPKSGSCPEKRFNPTAPGTCRQAAACAATDHRLCSTPNDTLPCSAGKTCLPAITTLTNVPVILNLCQ